jgi:trehalose 6-phosphate synthase/phosphatase
MFRALRHVPAVDTMPAPIAITSTCTPEEIEALPEVKVDVTPEGIFSTAVGPSSKKTLARWHVTSPEEVVDMMQHLLGDE